MFSINNNSVISLNTQQNRYLKTKAFFISLFLHIGLFALVAQYVSVEFITPLPEVVKPEKKTRISLSAYVPQVQSKTVVVKQEPKKPTPVKKEVKKVIPKKQEVVQKAQPVVKPESKPEPKPHCEETLQQTQEQEVKKEVVAPVEAFTPQVPDTELNPKIKEKNVRLAQQNSPLSEQKLSELALIRSLIQDALKYPSIAKRLRLEGVVVVSFSLSTTGRVSNLQLVQSSDSSVLDTRALQTVSSLDGEFPQLQKKVDLKIPIVFSLQQS